MFNRSEGRGSVLGICVTPSSFVGRSEAVDYRAVQSARRAIDMLRLVRFDFLLVNLKLPDISVWNFMRHVKTAWPQQKWALVGGPVSGEQEVAARMLEVSAFMEAPPAIEDVCKWESISDVWNTAHGAGSAEVAAWVEKCSQMEAAGTLQSYSKRTSRFEITGLRAAGVSGSVYAQNPTAKAV
jgi:DNA-binding NtrC family response regulator